MPVMFSAMSYGSISYNAHEALARAAQRAGHLLQHRRGRPASRTSINTARTPSCRWRPAASAYIRHYLEAGAAIEIKMGQGAKPGIGGHLPGAQDRRDISRNAHDPRRVGRHFARRRTTTSTPSRTCASWSFRSRRRPRTKSRCMVKIAAVHNVAAIASRHCAHAARTSLRSTASAAARAPRPTRIRDNVGIPDRAGACRRSTSACATRASATRFRSWSAAPSATAADVVKGHRARRGRGATSRTSALLALGCHLCRTCQTGKCNWGIATQRPELVAAPESGHGLRSGWSTW